MKRAPLRLAVLGHPLDYTRSPELHRAGFAALGLECESRAIRTAPESLGERLRALAVEGYLGVNLTAPLKQIALDHLASASAHARRARSVNTVGFGAAGAWGDTTDGPGFVDLLRWLGRDPREARALFLGAGGAARSLAFALVEEGCEAICLSARDAAAARSAWSDMPEARVVEWRSGDEAEALSAATLVVNATPLADARSPAPLDRVPRATLIMDLRYGPEPTPWIRSARAEGRHAWDGLGLLVFQARRSIELWLERPVPLEPLARAVGWPR